MLLVITDEKDVVLDVAQTNLKKPADLKVIQVGKNKKYLVKSEDAPKKGAKFDPKKAEKAPSSKKATE